MITEQYVSLAPSTVPVQKQQKQKLEGVRSHTSRLIANESSLRAEAAEWRPKQDVQAKMVLDQKHSVVPSKTRGKPKFHPNKSYSHLGNMPVLGSDLKKAQEALAYAQERIREFTRVLEQMERREMRVLRKIAESSKPVKSYKRGPPKASLKLRPSLDKRRDTGGWDLWGACSDEQVPEPLSPRPEPWVPCDLSELWDSLPVSPLDESLIDAEGVDGSYQLFTPTSGDEGLDGSKPPTPADGAGVYVLNAGLSRVLDTESVSSRDTIHAELDGISEYATDDVPTWFLDPTELRDTFTSGKPPPLGSRATLKISRIMMSYADWLSSTDANKRYACMLSIFLELCEELKTADVLWALEIVSRHYSVIYELVTGGRFIDQLRGILFAAKGGLQPTAAHVVDGSFLLDCASLLKGVVALVSCGGSKDAGLLNSVCEYLKTGVDYLYHSNTIHGLYKLCVRMYERGLLAFTTRNWQDFFSYDGITTWHTAVTSILLESLHLEGSVAEPTAFERVIAECDRLALQGREIAIKLGVRDRLYLSIDASVAKLTKASITLGSCKVRAKLHAPPWCALIVGDTSVGKSSASNLLIAQCFASFELVYNADSIYTHNPGDSFDSGFKNNKKIALVDDTGTMKANLDEGNFIPFVMRASNIQPAAATKAELDGKGAQYFQFDAIISTSNFRDGGSACRMDYWMAYIRRFKCHIELGIRDGYWKTAGEGPKLTYVLDETKFINDPDGINVAWVWKFCKVEAGQGHVSYVPNTSDLTPVELAAGACSGRGLEGVIQGYTTPVAMKIVSRLIFYHRKMNKVTDAYLRDLELRAPCPICRIITCHGCIRMPMEPTSLVVVGTFAVIVGQMLVILAGHPRTNRHFFDIASSIVKFAERISHAMTMAAFLAAQQRIPALMSEVIMPQINAAIPILENTLLSRVHSRVGELQQSIWREAGARLKTMLPLVVVGPAVYLLYRYLTTEGKVSFEETVAYRFEGRERDVEYEQRTSVPFIYPHSVDRLARPPLVKANNFFVNLVAHTTREALIKRVSANMYLVRIGTGGLSTALLITRKLLMLNQHALLGDGPWTLTFYGQMPISPAIITKDDVCKVGPDLCAVFLAAVHDSHDLLQYASELDFTASFQGGSELHLYRDVEDFDTVQIKEITSLALVTKIRYTGRTEDMSGFTCDLTGATNGNSGSVALTMNPSPRILGLQGGKTSSQCFFLPIPDAKALRAFRDGRMYPLPRDILSIPLPDDGILDLTPTSLSHDYAGHLVGHGSGVAYVGSDASIPPSRARTSFRRSIMYDDMVEVCPAVRDLGPPQLGRRIVGEGPYVYVDPLLVTSAFRALVRGSSPDWTLAVRCYTDYMQNAPVAEYGGPLSLDQALNGAGNIMRLNMSTACGYKMQGVKSSYCEQASGGSWSLKPDTAALYEQWRLNFYGKNRPLVATGVPKDEVRTFEKISQGRERIFQCMEFFAGIELRKYLGPFIAWFMHHREHFEHAVGINCQCEEWEKLEGRFSSRYRYCFDGDFAFFDVTHLLIFLELFHAMLDWFIRNCTKFTPTERYMAHFLWRRSIQIRYVVGRGFYIFVTGFASGHVITIIINCILSSMYMRLAFFILYPGAGSYRDEVVTVVYGDDNINNTDLAGFNILTVASALSAFGIGYTPASKKAVVDPFVPLEEITFLKRRFYNVDGLCLAPLEFKSLCKMMAFVKCQESAEREQLAQNLLTFQLEAWQYGREAFDEMSAWLQAVARKHDLHIAAADSSEHTTMRWRSHADILGMFRKGTIPMPLG